MMNHTTNHHQDNTMTLMGEGQVSTVPNVAIIRLGVETNGMNLEEIQRENAIISQAVLESLYDLGVTNIKTFQYNVSKDYDYVDGNRVDRGYTVRNIFEIRTTDIQGIGTIIDTAVANGANVIEFISFDVEDPEYYYQEALNIAVMNAIQKARSISDFLGLQREPKPISIVEHGGEQIPPTRFYANRESAFTTPIEPGQYQIKASVTVVFDFSAAHLKEY